MPDFRDRFRDPRWIEMRDELIDAAAGGCQGCGKRAKVDVSIPFLVADVPPWDFEPGSYKVYCETCWKSHREVEAEVKDTLRLLGFDHLDRIAQVLAALRKIPPADLSRRLDDLIHVAKVGLDRFLEEHRIQSAQEVAEAALVEIERIVSTPPTPPSRATPPRGVS